jgi:hypothetical protein
MRRLLVRPFLNGMVIRMKLRWKPCLIFSYWRWWWLRALLSATGLHKIIKYANSLYSV